jgi:O-acetyl-ADP-ribose deacetylase (regulator of RNase III)
MRILLVDRNPAVVAAWRSLGQEGECADIFTVKGDALVSPANSFGFMDGGIDAAYTAYFGAWLQRFLQDVIRLQFQGELLVGQATAIHVDHIAYQWMISAPTMRVPMPILDPNAVYLACRAAVREALRIGVETLVFPGMGTYSGRLDPNIAVRHMLAGINDGLNPPPFPTSFQEAYSRHIYPEI